MKKLAIIIIVSVLSTTLHFKVSCSNFFTSPQQGLHGSKPLKLRNSSLIVLNSSANVIQPGVNICTRSRLNPPLKTNTIYVGVIGTYTDPLLAHSHEQDAGIIANRTGCSPKNETKHCLIPGTVM